MDRLLWFKRDNAQSREDWIAGNKFIHIISILHNISYKKKLAYTTKNKGFYCVDYTKNHGYKGDTHQHNGYNAKPNL